MDGPADVGVNAAQAGDADNSKANTTPMDEEDPMKIMRVQDRDSAFMEASTTGPMVTVCIRVRNVPHRQLNTSPIPPL